MDMDIEATEIRERIRAAYSAKPRVSKKPWTVPAKTDFKLGRVLAFDQTVQNTGWAMVESTDTGPLIRKTGMCRPSKDDLTSFEALYARAAEVEDQLDALVQQFAWAENLTVVHEMPAIEGYRTESSLIVSYIIRRAATRAHLPVVMVNNQHMKAVLLPPHDRYEKAAVGRALVGLVDRTHLIVGSPWNQHVHDAVALGLTHLHKDER